MSNPGRSVLRGVFAGGVVFLGGMIAVAAVAVSAGFIEPLAADSSGAPALLPWILLEVATGVPLAVLSGRIALNVGRSRRAPLVLSSAVVALGSLEALTLLTSGYVPARSAAGVLVLVAPVLAALAILAGGRSIRYPLARLRAFGTGARWMTIGIAAPALLVTAGAAVGLLGLPSVVEFERQRVVAAALAVDLVLVLPLFVYAFLVRPGRLPLVSVVPAAVLGYGVAAFSIPTDHASVLLIIRWAAVPAEIALLSVVAVKARRRFMETASAGDFVQKLRSVVTETLGSRLAAEILTTEIAVLYFALHPRSEQGGTDGHLRFTAHRSVGYAAVLGGLTMAILVETPAVHILVRQASPIAAWILTGLSCYALLWLVGDFRALRTRLTTVTGTCLRFRLGLRWEADIPLTRVRSVRRVKASDRDGADDAFVGVPVGSPNVRIELTSPITIFGMYGLRKRTSVLLIRIDDPDRFIESLGGVIPAPGAAGWNVRREPGQRSSGRGL